LHLNLIAFGILYEPINTITGLIGNVLSRKHEYEADEYAVKHTNPEAFKNALKTLSTENLSDLIPHPAYVFVHYSHPTVLQRIRFIDSLSS
jgi:STE24 endopeptidase